MGFERRTLTVLLTLAIGMSSLYGVLRLLEPGQRTPLGGTTLMTLDPDAIVGPVDQLFQVNSPRNWQVIVVHDSGSATGSYETLERRHTAAGREGCGYHFVLNNGTVEPDGSIQTGYRWQYQQPGDFFDGETGRDFTRRFETIGICLIGNGDLAAPTAAQQQELERLIARLRSRFDIPADRVFIDTGTPGVTGLFPHRAFRERLAAADTATTIR